MRNISPKKYAVSLYQSLHGAEKEKIPTMIKAFIALVVRNQDMHKMDTIMKAFVAYANTMEKRVEVTVSSAHELAQTTRQAVAHHLQQALDRQVTIQAEVDPTLIGGLVLKYDDVIVDGSVKKRIELLSQTLRS